MTREEAIFKIMDLFHDDEELFNDIIEGFYDFPQYSNFELDRCYQMEDFDEEYWDVTPLQIADDILCGYDVNGGRFSTNRPYYYYDRSGRLVSTDRRDYSAYLDIKFIERLIDSDEQMYIYDDIAEIVDAIEENE